MRREGEGREEPVRGREGGEEREEERISFTYSRTGGVLSTRSCCAAIQTKGEREVEGKRGWFQEQPHKGGREGDRDPFLLCSHTNQKGEGK